MSKPCSTLNRTARDRCGPTGLPRVEQVPVAFDAVGPRRLIHQAEGALCPAARPPFTPL